MPKSAPRRPHRTLPLCRRTTNLRRRFSRRRSGGDEKTAHVSMATTPSIRSLNFSPARRFAFWRMRREAIYGTCFPLPPVSPEQLKASPEGSQCRRFRSKQGLTSSSARIDAECSRMEIRLNRRELNINLAGFPGCNAACRLAGIRFRKSARRNAAGLHLRSACDLHKRAAAS